MSDLALFDLDDIAPEWTPIYGYERGDICRDCGKEHSYGQGGARPGLGLYGICDGCAVIDGCQRRAERKNSDVEGWPEHHVSYWGEPHTAAEHERQLHEQAKRRAAWRRRRQ